MVGLFREYLSFGVESAEKQKEDCEANGLFHKKASEEVISYISNIPQNEKYQLIPPRFIFSYQGNALIMFLRSPTIGL